MKDEIVSSQAAVVLLEHCFGSVSTVFYILCYRVVVKSIHLQNSVGDEEKESSPKLLLLLTFLVAFMFFWDDYRRNFFAVQQLLALLSSISMCICRIPDRVKKYKIVKC